MLFPLFSRFGHEIFHFAETLGEFSIRPLQGRLGIQIEMPGKIDDREKKISDFFFNPCFVLFLNGAADFVKLFANLPEKRRYVSLRPVEPDMSRLRLYPKSPRQRR